MTYQIYYLPDGSPEGSRGYTVFDIEYYMKQVRDKDLWFSEIHCLPCVEGVSRFLKDQFGKEDFDLEQFIKDAYEIQELRGFLWERHDNKPKELKDARDFHYHGFNHEIESIFEVFVRRYDGMNLNVD